jgi:hypothetical protein
MANEFANFQKYNEKCQRMSIFADVEGDKIVITYFPCSTKDQFSKQTAWKMYDDYCLDIREIKSISHTVITVEDNKPKKTFLNWCNDNFYHKVERIEKRRHDVVYLEDKNNNRIVIKDRRCIDKLSMR